MKKNSKKIIGVLTGAVLLSAVIIIGVSMRKPDVHYDSMREYMESIYDKVRVPFTADRVQYTYKELMEAAKVVAVVTPLDDLTTDNSFGIAESGDIFYAAYSLREVKIVEAIKGDISVNESMQMAEKCVLLDDGTVVMDEGCFPMQKGDYYLVFLSASGYPGRPLLSISADNGKCDLTNLYLNFGYYWLFMEACADIWPEKQSRLNDIRGLVEAEWAGEIYQSRPDDVWDEFVFTTPYTKRGNGITIGVCRRQDETFYRVGTGDGTGYYRKKD